jgi:hypothetical protein
MTIFLRRTFCTASFALFGAGGAFGQMNAQIVPNVGTLAGTSAGYGSYSYVYLQGYNSANDGGQGLLVNLNTKGTPNNGSTFADVFRKSVPA